MLFSFRSFPPNSYENSTVEMKWREVSLVRSFFLQIEKENKQTDQIKI